MYIIEKPLLPNDYFEQLVLKGVNLVVWKIHLEKIFYFSLKLKKLVKCYFS